MVELTFGISIIKLLLVPERKAPIFKYNLVFKITFSMQVKKPSAISLQ